MTPIITEQDPESGEWEIVVEPGDKSTLDEIAQALARRSGTAPAVPPPTESRDHD